MSDDDDTLFRSSPMTHPLNLCFKHTLSVFSYDTPS